jgi:outer membrane protein TolC
MKLPRAFPGHVSERVLALCLLAALLPSGRPALAQEPPGTGAAAGTTSETPLRLSLDDAISRGLRLNLGVLLAESGETAARGERRQALAALLPSVSGHVSEDRMKLNLAAYGLPVAPGESPLVGPFDVFDARIAVDQKVFDQAARERSKAGRAGLEAARADVRDARDLVVLAVTRLYLGVIADRARLQATEAELETAQALADLAKDQLAAGTVAKIDVLRSRVELDARRQRRIVAANDLEKDKLSLARAIGLPLAQAIELTDPVPYAPAPAVGLDQAFAEARSRRGDLAAAKARLAAARASLAAARGERLPSISVKADWGTIGPTPSASLTTFDVGAVLGIPLFLGGRVHSDVLAAEAGVREAQSRLSDLQAQVEYEIRGALLDLDAADQRVTTAQAARDLADDQLTEARDRLRAGVSGSLEVVQAQQSVAAAHESYIASLYAYNLAKVTLARALGVAEERTAEFLKGSR